ncbi:MAG: hypothetical protein FJ083_15795, partial [Cyanobacteria bacterium K_Offshore_surface_m2_239]|nr:hypothetical protein [Cyanobacteria bacterium K_Offshore_surface_m2_239]
MAEPLSGRWPEHLEGLLERLRQAGFRVGVADTIRVHQLLLALTERGVMLESPERLTRLLGPVLCRSASEQEAFGRHVAEWWPETAVIRQLRAGAEEASTAAASRLEVQLTAVERRRQRVLRWLSTIPLAMGITAAVAAAGVVGVVGLRWRMPSYPAPVPVGMPSPGKPITKPPGTNAGKPTPSIPAPPASPRPPGSGSAPSPPDLPIPSPSDDGLFLLPGEIALLALLAVMASLLAVRGAVSGWWWSQPRLVLEGLQLRGDPKLHRLAIREIEGELVPLMEARRVGQALNLWQRLPSEELDGVATVEASLRKGGWLSPRHRHRRQRQSYLFFLDQESLDDQQTPHLRLWLERLDLEGVLVHWVCFQRDPLHGRGPNGHGPLLPLVELLAQHPEALVVVVADGERFFSPVDGTLRPWLRDLSAWPRQVVLTPRPCERWGPLEAELAQHIPVLPATPEGLLQLGRWLREAPSLPSRAFGPGASPAGHVTSNALEFPESAEPPLLRSGPRPWLDPTPPAPKLVRALLEQLRAFLGDAGYYWLAACAVFPELHWAITLHLGHRLCGADGSPLQCRRRLSRLTGLPWLRHGFMPDWLRLSLIQELTPTREAAVRQVLATLVLAAVEGGDAGEAELRVATEVGSMLPLLMQPLLEELSRRASP